MLCEGILLSMTYGDQWEVDRRPCRKPLQDAHGLPRGAATLLTGSETLLHHISSDQTGRVDNGRAKVELYNSFQQSMSPRRQKSGRQISPEIEIPAQACSVGESPFLVPSFCQSICQNYSDLQIGGEQVLPLSASDGELRLGADSPAGGPFLQSCDVLPPVEESPPGHSSQGGLVHLLRGGSNRWRQMSAQDHSFLSQDRVGPFSNSLLNRYLEQKLMDLYQQYMMENIAKEGDPHAGPICPLLGSELVLTSLDQITLQLSREGNLEAGLAKDMVLSYLLRVAGDKHSSELSTPLLQISSEVSREQLTENKEE